jgi:hypothetical protein
MRKRDDLEVEKSIQIVSSSLLSSHSLLPDNHFSVRFNKPQGSVALLALLVLLRSWDTILNLPRLQRVSSSVVLPCFAVVVLVV